MTDEEINKFIIDQNLDNKLNDVNEEAFTSLVEGLKNIGNGPKKELKFDEFEKLTIHDDRLKYIKDAFNDQEITKDDTAAGIKNKGRWVEKSDGSIGVSFNDDDPQGGKRRSRKRRSSKKKRKNKKSKKSRKAKKSRKSRK
jgi:hypothetical protein